MTQPSQYEDKELDSQLKPFHSTHCRTNTAWFRGQTEPFPCDCRVQDLKQLITKKQLEAQVDILKRLPTIRTNVNNGSNEDVVLKRQIDQRIAELKKRNDQ